MIDRRRPFDAFTIWFIVVFGAALLLAYVCLCGANSYMKGNYEEVGFGQKSYMVAYPNKYLTPGAVLPVTSDDVCQSGYSRKVRSELKRKDKQKIYERYDLPYDTTKYQIDHLVPISIGGSNSSQNLWPQPILNNAGYYEKQQVAQWLHEMVCSGKMDIELAQEIMIRDWHHGWHMLQHERGKE